MIKILCSFVLVFLANMSIGQVVPYERDPRFNSTINPRFNSSINPNYNASISPKFSFNLNPKISPNLNPNFTFGINPKYAFNLDPRYNFSINPRYTIGLSPIYIKENGGMYVFNEYADLVGYLTRANENILLYFNKAGIWIGYFVKAESIFNLFTLEAEWTGQYLCSDGDTGFNLFNEDGEWTSVYVK